MAKCVIHMPKKRKPMRDWMVVTIVYIVIIAIFMEIMFCLSNKNQKPIENYFITYSNATNLIEVKYDYSLIWGNRVAVGFMDNNFYQEYKDGKYEKETIEIYHPYIEGKSSIISTNSIITMYKVTKEYVYHRYPPNRFTK